MHHEKSEKVLHEENMKRAQCGKTATWKEYNITKVQHKKATRKECNTKKGQYEKSATPGKCMIQKTKHGKSATWKKCNMKIAQYKQNIKPM